MQGAIGPSARPKSTLTVTNPPKLVTKPIKSTRLLAKVIISIQKLMAPPCRVTIHPQIVRRAGIKMLGPILRRMRFEGSSARI